MNTPVRGHFIFANDFIDQINFLLADARKFKAEIGILGNPAYEKLAGVQMALRGMKDMIFNLEKYGDLTVLPDPKKGGDNPNAETVAEDNTPKIILP